LSHTSKTTTKFYQEKLTEEIDCPCKPTSRDPIHLQFKSITIKDTLFSYF